MARCVCGCSGAGREEKRRHGLGRGQIKDGVPIAAVLLISYCLSWLQSDILGPLKLVPPK